MRLRLALLVVCALGVALPASAARKPPDITVVKPVLRGPQSPPVVPADPAPPVVPATGAETSYVAPLAGPGYSPIAPADTGQCRAACSRGYYFCSSTEDPSDCSATWTQCSSRCRYPGYAAGVPR